MLQNVLLLGKRKRGRPTTRWKDKKDMESGGGVNGGRRERPEQEATTRKLQPQDDQKIKPRNDRTRQDRTNMRVVRER